MVGVLVDGCLVVMAGGGGEVIGQQQGSYWTVQSTCTFTALATATTATPTDTAMCMCTVLYV